MISRAGLLGLLLMAAFATWSSAFAFRQPGLRIREDTGRRFDGATEVEALGISSIPIGKRQLGGARTGNGRRYEKTSKLLNDFITHKGCLCIRDPYGLPRLHGSILMRLDASQCPAWYVIYLLSKQSFVKFKKGIYRLYCCLVPCTGVFFVFCLQHQYFYELSIPISIQ